MTTHRCEAHWRHKGERKFQIGDRVEPRPEWKGIAPTGCVRAIAPWGDDGALYVSRDVDPGGVTSRGFGDKGLFRKV
jgi:hypothetical protein